jgi:hypothetical protein
MLSIAHCGSVIVWAFRRNFEGKEAICVITRYSSKVFTFIKDCNTEIHPGFNLPYVELDLSPYLEEIRIGNNDNVYKVTHKLA